MDKIRRKGTPIGQYGSDLDFGVPPSLLFINDLLINIKSLAVGRLIGT